MMLKKIAGIGMLVATASLSPQWYAFSEEENAAEESAILDELSLGDILSMKITTGSFLDLDLTKSPLSMTIITRDMVRNSGARNISELLEIYVPGFIYNINPYYGTVWGMRGVSNDRNTKVIYCVNGHKMNNQARDGAQGETTLGLLGDIERVEVLRGPAGLVYGSGAIAGIINVVTRKGEGNKSNATVTASLDGSKSVEANLYGNPSDGVSFTANAGYRQSDGLPLGATRIYPRSGSAPGNLGVPSDGRYGSTDGNWKIAADLTIKNFNFYMRGTSQTENGASYFTLAPWADRWGQPSTDSAIATWGSREVDGIMVQPMDPFWKNRNNWRSSRKNYRSDNFTSEASYKIDIGENQLKTKLNYDMNTTIIGEENLEQYKVDHQYKNQRTIEEFGEKRYLLNATYLLKTVDKLQAALGIEDRIDQIGNSIRGKNEQLWNPKHYIVKEINYNTLSLFGEGFYDITDYLGVHGGLRFDFHTRANFASPKLAVVYHPNENHSIKVIYQSAANNGSADNYEFNRDQVDNNGFIVTAPVLISPALTPSDTSKIKQPAELSEMHSLKPERVHSFEISYVGKLFDGFTIEPSVSVNKVNDLFVWEQKLFRVVNCGSYSFFDGDLSVKYSNKFFKAGINHTYQRPINMDVGSQKKNFSTYSIKDSVVNGDTVYGEFVGLRSTGDSMFVPYYEKGTQVNINLVGKSVTYDGLNFLNLPTNMTKLFVDFSPFEWITISTNLRLTWGYIGREATINSTNAAVNKDNKADEGNYWGYYGEKKPANLRQYFMEMVSKKWNASLNFNLPADLEASFYIYNILGTDAHNYVNKRADKNTVNTLRASQMYDYPNRELYSIDQRTFGVTFTKNF
jgi:outer membrane receptor protein involved in Fe transport